MSKTRDDGTPDWLKAGAAPLTGTEPTPEPDPDVCINGGPCPGSNCGSC